MPDGIVGLGMWCVDTTYKINKLPERGKLEPIIDKFQCVGGGPCNVLTDLYSLGFKSKMIAMGSVGIDANASFIKRHCKANGITTNYLVSNSKVPTSQTICMTEQQKERTFLYYSGANELLDKKHFRLKELKKNPKLLYVGYITLLGKLDSFTGKETRLNTVLKEAKRNNLINVLDLVSNNDPNFKKIVYSALPFTDYLLLNEIEAQLLFNKKVIKSNNTMDRKLIRSLSKKVFQKGLQKAIIIHSPKESLYLSRNKIYHTKSLNVPKQQIKNSVGAGDAFCASFLYGIHENWNIQKTLIKSHAAGAAMMKIDASSGYLPNINKL
tara:strand:+ start:4083 stop:5057 length:975 start_codon:yes stop_codon:yes gene_type:complete